MRLKGRKEDGKANITSRHRPRGNNFHFG